MNHGAVSCLNASNGDAAKDVLRPWDQRRNRTPCLESNDDDPELLIRVPFTTDVKARTGEFLRLAVHLRRQLTDLV